MVYVKIPFLLFQHPRNDRLIKRMRAIGLALVPVVPTLKTTLQKIRYDATVELFLTAAALSSFLYGLLFFTTSFAALLILRQEVSPLPQALGIGIAIWALFFVLHIIYPAIEMRKIAIKENKDLLFALREVIIDVDGGVPLFDSLKNVSHAGYGYVSDEFERVVRQVESGVSEREAIKQLALKTESEFLKRASWQMVNALESGAKMSDALEHIAIAVEAYLFREIKNYSTNLNFLLLIYMLAGVVAPSLGITFMVLLSAFSGLGVTIESVAMLLGFTMMIQIVILGYMGSLRPELFGG
jgi:flagellar protein FlaJ